MKVAIIGAGLSGMACAYVMKNHGIIPTLFERKGYIGEILELPAIQFNIFNTIVKDPVKHLKDKYGLSIMPHYDLKEIVMVSPTKTYTINGNMGYVFLRGREKGYITIQLKNALDLPATLNTLGNVNELKTQYDHVVVADGTMQVAQQMNTATIHFDAFVRIASVLGDFDTSSIKVWMNTKYAKNGYAYLVPITNKSASLVLIVNNIQQNELEYYWNEFVTTENITYPIIEIKELRHITGVVEPVQVENIYFVGNAGGFLDSLLGFGSTNALISGAMAATCMINGLDYNKEMKTMIKDIKKKYEFRKVFNTFENDDLDRLVTMENFPLVKQFIFNNPLLKVTQGTFLAKTYNAMKSDEGKK